MPSTVQDPVPPIQAARIIDAPEQVSSPMAALGPSPLAMLESAPAPRANNPAGKPTSARTNATGAPLASTAQAAKPQGRTASTPRPTRAATAAKPTRAATKPVIPVKAAPLPYDPDADLLALLLQRRLPPRSQTPDN